MLIPSFCMRTAIVMSELPYLLVRVPHEQCHRHYRGMLSPVASQGEPERDRTRPAELALVDQRTVLRDCERKSRLRPRTDAMLRGRFQRALSWRQNRTPPVHPTRLSCAIQYLQRRTLPQPTR